MSPMNMRSRCSRPSTAALPSSTRSCAASPTRSSDADDVFGTLRAWIFDANGKSLVNSLASPPQDLSFADRDYFYAHVDQNIGTFVGAAQVDAWRKCPRRVLA